MDIYGDGDGYYGPISDVFSWLLRRHGRWKVWSNILELRGPGKTVQWTRGEETIVSDGKKVNLWSDGKNPVQLENSATMGKGGAVLRLPSATYEEKKGGELTSPAENLDTFVWRPPWYWKLLDLIRGNDDRREDERLAFTQGNDGMWVIERDKRKPPWLAAAA